MRTALHVGLILLAAVGLGLLVRSTRHSASERQRPSGDDVVYTTDVAPGATVTKDRVANEVAETESSDPGSGEPSRPPADEDWLSRFELTERSGKLVRSESLLGEPYVVSFFFSTCPSICIQQNQKLKELQDDFEGEGVHFVAISVDPETDTPEALREYAARFGADPEQWLFLTGDLTYIRRVGAEVFRLPVDQKFHTERFVLVNPEGKIEGYYDWTNKRQFESLQEDIHRMLDGAEAGNS